MSQCVKIMLVSESVCQDYAGERVSVSRLCW